jgi:hypothetical protein
MSPKKDPTSIGSILVAMGVITEDQLNEVTSEQNSIDILLGKLLVANGLISPVQLESALMSQQGLRSNKKHLKAIAQAKIAECGGGAVINFATQIRQQSTEIKKSVTGTEFPAVSGGMMDKKIG